MPEAEHLCDSTAGIGLRVIVDSRREEDFFNEKAGGVFQAERFFAGGSKGGYYLSIYLRNSKGDLDLVAKFQPNEWAGIRVLF